MEPHHKPRAPRAPGEPATLPSPSEVRRPPADGVVSAFLSEFETERDDRPVDAVPLPVLREMFGRPATQPSAVPVRGKAIGRRRRIGLWTLVSYLVLAALSAVVFTAAWNAWVGSSGSSLIGPALPPAPLVESPLPAVSLPPGATATTEGAETVGVGRYAIQVALFETRVRAERLLGELATLGLEGRVVERDQPGGVLQQVVIDGYATAEQADADLARVRALPGYADAHVLSSN